MLTNVFETLRGSGKNGKDRGRGRRRGIRGPRGGNGGRGKRWVRSALIHEALEDRRLLAAQLLEAEPFDLTPSVHVAMPSGAGLQDGGIQIQAGGEGLPVADVDTIFGGAGDEQVEVEAGGVDVTEDTYGNFAITAMSQAEGEGTSQGFAHWSLDTNGDRLVTPVDVLIIINWLNGPAMADPSAQPWPDSGLDPVLEMHVEATGPVRPDSVAQLDVYFENTGDVPQTVYGLDLEMPVATVENVTPHNSWYAYSIGSTVTPRDGKATVTFEPITLNPGEIVGIDVRFDLAPTTVSGQVVEVTVTDVLTTDNRPVEILSDTDTFDVYGDDTGNLPVVYDGSVREVTAGETSLIGIAKINQPFHPQAYDAWTWSVAGMETDQFESVWIQDEFGDSEWAPRFSQSDTWSFLGDDYDRALSGGWNMINRHDTEYYYLYGIPAVSGSVSTSVVNVSAKPLDPLPNDPNNWWNSADLPSRTWWSEVNITDAPLTDEGMWVDNNLWLWGDESSGVLPQGGHLSMALGFRVGNDTGIDQYVTGVQIRLDNPAAIDAFYATGMSPDLPWGVGGNLTPMVEVDGRTDVILPMCWEIQGEWQVGYLNFFVADDAPQGEEFGFEVVKVFTTWGDAELRNSFTAGYEVYDYAIPSVTVDHDPASQQGTVGELMTVLDATITTPTNMKMWWLDVGMTGMSISSFQDWTITLDGADVSYDDPPSHFLSTNVVEFSLFPWPELTAGSHHLVIQAVPTVEGVFSARVEPSTYVFENDGPFRRQAGATIEPNQGAVHTVIPKPEQADLAVVLTGPAMVEFEGTVVYTATVTNTGPDDASNVVLIDTLPPHTTFDVARSSSECASDGVNVTCDIPSLRAENTRSIVIALRVGEAAGCGEIVNQVEVTAYTQDPDPANNVSAPVVTQIACPDPELPVALSAGNPVGHEVNPYVAGEVHMLGLQVTNDPLNPGAIAAPFRVLGVNIEVTGDVGDMELIVLRDGSGTMLGIHEVSQQSASYAFTAPVSVAVDEVFSVNAFGVFTTDAEGQFSLKAHAFTTPSDVTFAGFPLVGGTFTAVQPQADLVLTAMDGPVEAVQGGTATYTLTAQNNGPDAANVSIAITVPGGLTFHGSSNPGWILQNGTVQYHFGELGDGESGTASVVYDVTGQPGIEIDHRALIPAVYPDPNPVNNVGVVVTTITAPLPEELVVEANNPVGREVDPLTEGEVLMVSLPLANGMDAPVTISGANIRLRGTVDGMELLVLRDGDGGMLGMFEVNEQEADYQLLLGLTVEVGGTDVFNVYGIYNEDARGYYSFQVNSFDVGGAPLSGLPIGGNSFEVPTPPLDPAAFDRGDAAELLTIHYGGLGTIDPGTTAPIDVFPSHIDYGFVVYGLQEGLVTNWLDGDNAFMIDDEVVWRDLGLVAMDFYGYQLPNPTGDLATDADLLIIQQGVNDFSSDDPTDPITWDEFLRGLAVLDLDRPSATDPVDAYFAALAATYGPMMNAN